MDIEASIGNRKPQDPNDEPAEKLLERVMAEKAKLVADRPPARGRRAKKPKNPGSKKKSPPQKSKNKANHDQ